MSLFQFQARYDSGLAHGWGIRALLNVEDDDGSVLYAASEASGGLMALSRAGDGSLTLIDALGAAGGRGTYGVVGLDAVYAEGQLAILPAGRFDDRLAFHRIGADGGFDSVRILGASPEFIGAIEATLSFDIDGKTFMVAAQQGAEGFRTYRVRDDLSLEIKAHFPDTPAEALSDVSAFASLQIGGRSYFFAADTQENAVSSYWMGRWGNVKHRDTVDSSDGLYISAPTAMETVEIAGKGYLILGSAGSDSLTCLRINQYGGMFVTDHLIDTRDTRFGGVQAMDSFEYNGRSFILAGGSDDGLTLLEVAHTGRFIVHDAIPDTLEATLTNVSAIEAVRTAQGLDIYVTSGAEHGISHFKLDLSVFGITRTGGVNDDTLSGTALNDIIVGADGDDLFFGGAGDDIIIDGAGVDTMEGGDGADTFVFLNDGRLDRVVDFDPGMDKLDLSDYPLLYSPDRLDFTQKLYGVLIEYAGDRFRIETEGRQLMVSELGADEFIFA